MSALSELAIGAGLILGLLTPFAAAGVVATMTVAFWAIHRFSGFFVFRRPDEGYEYVATLAVVSVVLGLLGPGSMSVDALLGLDDTFSGALGAAIVLGGFVIGLGQLALFWRKPA
jgi:putative oxidoreductase